MSKIIAVDFDGVLCKNAYPDIGEPLDANMELIRRLKANGCTIILNTCRTEPYLTQALEWLKPFNLPIDYVNINDPGQKNLYGADCRKISADIYIDDKAYNPDPEALKKLISEFIGDKNMVKGQTNSTLATQTVTSGYIQTFDVEKTPCNKCTHKDVCSYKEKAKDVAEKYIKEPFRLTCDHFDAKYKITTYPNFGTPSPVYDYITTTHTTPSYCKTCGYWSTAENKCMLEGKIMGITGLPCQQITCETAHADTSPAEQPILRSSNKLCVEAIN